ALLAIVPDTVQPAALEPVIAPVAPIDKLKVVTPSKAVPIHDPVISEIFAGVLYAAMSDAEVLTVKLAGIPFAVTVPETLIPVWYVALKLPAAAGVTP
ncbi:MAG: hypothetical protein COW39_09215, partial [Comamonadaceae bacterium CG17_big_fil_post_rev_8_21_14_2_50_60_13]